MIATIISYCTNDFRFIDKCIEEAEKFSSQIIIPICDHFFDGREENRLLLNHTYTRHPHSQFIEFAYLPDRLYSSYHSIGPQDTDWPFFWGATARYIGWHYLNKDIEFVLFIDADEIVEGEKMKQWIAQGEHLKYDLHRFAVYLYALKSHFRAKTFVNHPPFLVKRSTFSPHTFLHRLERTAAYLSHPGPKQSETLGLDQKPMIHHYSWVRTKEECIQKTETWSHRNDAPWPTLIQEAFEGKTNRPFWGHHEFEEISSIYFDPFAIPIPTNPLPPFSVLKITDSDLFRKEIESTYLKR